jgi:hypothetical protein
MTLQAFFSGMLIFNGIPHLVSGITGKTHMTPFKRVSSPFLNVIWAFINLVFGFIIWGFDSETGSLNQLTGFDFWAFILGGLMLSITAAWLFGRPNARLPWHKD